MRTRIELALGDAKMIHISGAMTVRDMWDQLTTVKESRGRLGVLATQQALYRALVADDFEMIDHISKLRKLQEELHLMGSIVTDEDFVMILITSLPEAWDNYMSPYLRSSRNRPELRSHEIVAILLDKDQRRKERSGNSGVGRQLCRQKEREMKMWIRNATIVKRRVICRKIAGQKEEAWRGKGLEGGKDQ